MCLYPIRSPLANVFTIMSWIIPAPYINYWHCFIHPIRSWLHPSCFSIYTNIDKATIFIFFFRCFLVSANFPGSIMSNPYLVGGLNPSEKYESQLGWWDSQLNGKISFMFQSPPISYSLLPESSFTDASSRVLKAAPPLALRPTSAKRQAPAWVMCSCHGWSDLVGNLLIFGGCLIFTGCWMSFSVFFHRDFDDLLNFGWGG